MIKLHDKADNVKLFDRAGEVQFRDRATLVKMKFSGQEYDFSLRDNTGAIIQDNNSIDLTDNR